MKTNPATRSSSDPTKNISSPRSFSYNAPIVPDVNEESSTLKQSPQSRPSLSKFETERPNPTERTSILTPGLNRHATNTSLLNEAIWSSPNNHDSTSTGNSSSSDEEDEDDGVAAKKNPPGRGRKRSQTHRGSRGSYSRFNVGNDDFKTNGKVSRKDGRLNISVNETSNRGYLAKALGATILKDIGSKEDEDDHGKDSRSTSPGDDSAADPQTTRPKLNIVVMVIGSRGDIQPFLKLGKSLKEYGHRVRIATHPAFKYFVQNDSGLEFFSVGGDPAELMAFMVKNPGMIPTMETLKKGEVGRRREQMAEIFEGFWRACINATDDEKDVSNMKMMGKNAPFIADAIISNPPTFAHIHCAERLGVPLHLMFTFPYTPTQAFPHPLANIKKINVDPGYANFISYPLVEMMTWQGLGDLVNIFRVKTLGLEPVSTLWAPGQLYRLKVPYTYLWSPGLVPKPKDWGPEIDIAGFVFLDLASSFEPPDELTKFLEAGEPPVYVGFGSIVVDDPDKFTKMIFEAVEKAGVRALVSKGWGGLGDDNVPDSVFMLENTPHDWLFPKVSAVVHHGGAGTTAIGLKCGKPTMIVPFFGDQQFWGTMIGESGAGAHAIPYKNLDADKLADSIKQCLTEEARRGAEKIAKRIEEEGDGAKNAVTSFHRSLVLRGQHSMRCSVLEDRVAVWNLKNTYLRLSALAAELLVEKKRISWKQLRLIRHNEWNDFEGPGEPLTGVSTAIMGTVTNVATGVGSVPFRIIKSSKKRAKHDEKKQRLSRLKHQGSGRRSKMPRDIPNRKADGNRKDDQTNGVVKNSNNENEDPESSTKKDSADGIPNEKVPARRGDKVTNGPDMGKHTTSGEPMSQEREANMEEKREHEHERQSEDKDSELSDDPDDTAAQEMANDVGDGVSKTAEALARAPMDLALALSQGFHNAPRLYGDTTVRRPPRITGYKSGLKAAGEEFTFGIYDGFTGVVTQPYTGARDNGAIGFVKGTGMGLAGFVLKNISAAIGPFGYTFKGLHKELLKGHQPTHFIRKARILEGARDLKGLSKKEKKQAIDAVNHGWSVVQQIWAIMEEKRTRGLMGRLKVMKERKTWRANGAFENVEMAERALEARKNGEDLEGVFTQQRKELKKTHKPRKNVVDDIDEGNGGKGDNGAQPVQANGYEGSGTKETPTLNG